MTDGFRRLHVIIIIIIKVILHSQPKLSEEALAEAKATGVSGPLSKSSIVITKVGQNGDGQMGESEEDLARKRKGVDEEKAGKFENCMSLQTKSLGMTETLKFFH